MSDYSVDEIAQKILLSTHIIGINSPLESNENIMERDEYMQLMNLLMNESNLVLAVGAIIADEMRNAVFETTKFTCSAGIATNKVKDAFVSLLEVNLMQEGALLEVRMSFGFITELKVKWSLVF